MKVPSIKEVYATLEQMCKDGKMDDATREFYEDPANSDVVIDAETLRMLDEVETEGHLRDEIEENLFKSNKYRKN